MIDGLNELIRDLSDAPRKVQFGAARVVEQAAKKGAEEARRLAPRGRYLPHYARTITAELRADVRGQFVGEFGPEKRGQGNLGHLIEFGSPTSGPYAHVGPAMDLVTPEFVRGLSDLDPL